jgi:hypothetical protein
LPPHPIKSMSVDPNEPGGGEDGGETEARAWHVELLLVPLARSVR